MTTRDEAIAKRVAITRLLLEAPAEGRHGFGLPVVMAPKETLQTAVVRVVATLTQADRLTLRDTVDWVEDFDRAVALMDAARLESVDARDGEALVMSMAA